MIVRYCAEIVSRKNAAQEVHVHNRRASNLAMPVVSEAELIHIQSRASERGPVFVMLQTPYDFH